MDEFLQMLWKNIRFPFFIFTAVMFVGGLIFAGMSAIVAMVSTPLIGVPLIFAWVGFVFTFVYTTLQYLSLKGYITFDL